MILTNEQIRSVAFGATDVDFNGANACFYRIKPEQCARIHALDPSLGIKAFATAGVRLDFYTDSEYFAFSYSVTVGSSRDYYNFALLIDNKEYALVGEKPATLYRGCYETVLKKGKKRITLFFPCLFNASLEQVVLSDGASITPFVPKIIDLWNGVPHDLALFTDGLHPNDDGFALYADGIKDAVIHSLKE